MEWLLQERCVILCTYWIGFLNQTSVLEPKQIMTDTAGYSDLVFGIFGLLGFQFSPRIANNHGTKLWRINLTTDYKMLNEVSQNKINTTRIEKSGTKYFE